MSDNGEFQLRIFDEQQRQLFIQDFGKPVELGRQAQNEPGPFHQRVDASLTRIVVAPYNEDTISRKHLLLEPLPGDRCRLRNLSAQVPIRIANGTLVAPGTDAEYPLPLRFYIGRRMVSLAPTDQAEIPLNKLSEATMPPGSFSGGSSRLQGLSLSLSGDGSPGDQEKMIRWLQAAMDVIHSAANSTDFFDKAARAAVDLVALDTARVLLYVQGDWRPESFQTSARTSQDLQSPPSRKVLKTILETKTAIWEKPDGRSGDSNSLESLSAVVAAPILSKQGEVIGALYGDRSMTAIANYRGPITKLEALLVDLLAGAIAAGIERRNQETAAIKAKVQFEQFFTKDLATEMAADPNLLAGRQCEISVLFCDIRGFSKVSEKLPPSGVVEWLNDVMSCLSDSVLENDGVLVDYIGDELMAMWGAPKSQPNHALLACKAAMNMIEKLPELSAKWEARINCSMDLGIGINSGLASVGNTGSSHKFKYGPLGNTVNLASRVQGVTKYYKSRLIITEHTRAKLDQSVLTRRLGKVRVVNIGEPVELYEVFSSPDAADDKLRLHYEKALGHFEMKDLRPAAQLLGQLQLEYTGDGPSLVLLSRVVQSMVALESWDPVWTLHGK